MKSIDLQDLDGVAGGVVIPPSPRQLAQFVDRIAPNSVSLGVNAGPVSVSGSWNVPSNAASRALDAAGYPQQDRPQPQQQQRRPWWHALAGGAL